MWWLINHKNTLCYHVLSSKYFLNGDVFHPKAVDEPFYSWTSILYAVKALESSFGWQISDGMKERFGFDRWGFKGLDGNYLRASLNGNRDGLVWDRDWVEELYGNVLNEEFFALPIVQNGPPQ